MIITDKLESILAVDDGQWVRHPDAYAATATLVVRQVVKVGEEHGAFLSEASVRCAKVRNPELDAVARGRKWAVRGYWSPPTSKGVELVGGYYDGRVVKLNVPDTADGYPDNDIVVPTVTDDPLSLATPMSPVAATFGHLTYERFGINSATDRWVYQLQSSTRNT